MQQKALRHAENLEFAATVADEGRPALSGDFRREAAAELRRQHALIAELVTLLRELRGSLAPTYRMSPEGRAYIEKMDAALSKAKEQQHANAR